MNSKTSTDGVPAPANFLINNSTTALLWIYRRIELNCEFQKLRKSKKSKLPLIKIYQELLQPSF